MMNLKLKVSSSSLLSLRIKFGDVEGGNGSGSYRERGEFFAVSPTENTGNYT
jgi:hypothetical protein